MAIPFATVASEHKAQHRYMSHTIHHILLYFKRITNKHNFIV